MAGYLDMRRAGMVGGKKVITATTRQLESLIRLSEAHARMRLSLSVTADDVAEAVRLINVATQRAAVDPRTGTINMDLITTGHTAAERDAVSMLIEAMRSMLSLRVPKTSYNVASLIKDMARESDVRERERGGRG